MQAQAMYEKEVDALKQNNKRMLTELEKNVSAIW